jgi:hypothetical protein
MRTPNLVVYDGRTCVGHIVRRSDSFEAFDVDGTSYGTFADMKSAAFAIPAKSAPAAASFSQEGMS